MAALGARRLGDGRIVSKGRPPGVQKCTPLGWPTFLLIQHARVAATFWCHIWTNPSSPHATVSARFEDSQSYLCLEHSLLVTHLLTL